MTADFIESRYYRHAFLDSMQIPMSIPVVIGMNDEKLGCAESFFALAYGDKYVVATSLYELFLVSGGKHLIREVIEAFIKRGLLYSTILIHPHTTYVVFKLIMERNLEPYDKISRFVDDVISRFKLEEYRDYEIIPDNQVEADFPAFTILARKRFLNRNKFCIIGKRSIFRLGVVKNNVCYHLTTT